MKTLLSLLVLLLTFVGEICLYNEYLACTKSVTLLGISIVAVCSQSVVLNLVIYAMIIAVVALVALKIINGFKDE